MFFESCIKNGFRIETCFVQDFKKCFFGRIKECPLLNGFISRIAIFSWFSEILYDGTFPSVIAQKIHCCCGCWFGLLGSWINLFWIKNFSKSSGDIEEVKLTESKSQSQVLTESEIERLSDYGLQIEKHYKKPQDIEFAIENRQIYILQSRPITTEAKESKVLHGEVLLAGLPASPGVGTGKVKIIKNLNDLDKIQKGDVIAISKTAGIMAAKKTSELIPLCHPLNIASVDIDFGIDKKQNKIDITSKVKVEGQTGVEMEALTAVSVASLTMYDMCKAVDKEIIISDIMLVEKTGGKSGAFRRK